MTDWRDYDSIYTERYMGLPQDNPDGYNASSVVRAAGKLHGRLLILHGAIDDNVSLRNTMRLVQRAATGQQGLRADDLPVVAARHRRAHYQRIQNEFIRRTLLAPKAEPSRPRSPGEMASPGQEDSRPAEGRGRRRAAGSASAR